MRCIPPAELGHSKTGAHDKIHSGHAGVESMSGLGEGLVGTLLCEGATVPTKSGSLEPTSGALFVLRPKFVLHI